jgi:hypothetical protein
MHALLIATILLARTTSSPSSSGLPTGAEAPSAADLLRAKRMADDAARRLQVRPPKRGSWEPGGGGWTPSSSAPAGDPLPTHKPVR